MSASLLSDMESFKAANPNGKLEDFIRWYSPRDWIEDANAKTIDGKREQKRMRKQKRTIQIYTQTLHLFRADSGSCSDDTNQMRKGRLSSRMLIPGNTWQAVWNAAKPVPARRQVFFFLCWFLPLLDLNFHVFSSRFEHAIFFLLAATFI